VQYPILPSFVRGFPFRVILQRVPKRFKPVPFGKIFSQLLLPQRHLFLVQVVQIRPCQNGKKHQTTVSMDPSGKVQTSTKHINKKQCLVERDAQKWPKPVIL
jgi:hypothetical protein